LSNYFTEIPLDKIEIAQSKLNIENKSRSNPLKWNGQFSPQLIEILLKTYSTQKDKIFDPFLGSGTVLLEAGIQGLSARGTEVNPGAFILSRTYLYINIPIHLRREYLNNVSTWLDENFDLPLFSKITIIDEDSLKQTLTHFAAKDDWERILVEALIVLLDLTKEGANQQKIFEIWRRVSQHILKLPYSEMPIQIDLADARATNIESSWADLVITSPPYINVFNYHQQYRASLEFLNYDLLEIAKSEIGSNRKHRSNRFLTVIQYCLDMALVFQELRRITQPDARIISIVGRESSVRGTPFYNGQIVAEIAHNALGYNLEVKQERHFRNRFGQDIYEDILHFRIGQSVEKAEKDCLDAARVVAQNALEKAYITAIEDVRLDIKQAIDHVNHILPSFLFDTSTMIVK
jgi:DNA modification methylase